MEERQTRQCTTGTVMSPYRDNPHLEQPHIIELPLRGSISRKTAAALPSSSPMASAVALLPSSPTSAMVEGGMAARECADHDTTLFFPIGSGIRRCGSTWAWRPRCSSLLPQQHRQRCSSLLPQQGAPSSSRLSAVTASSLLRIQTRRCLVQSYITTMCITLHW
jgi:hypothetical protein